MRTDIIERKEEILKWISENKSKAFICRKLACRPITLEGYLIVFNIKYDGNKGNKGNKIPTNRKSALEYSKKETLSSNTLRIKLIQDGIKEEKCEICNNHEWLGNKIPLELHHVDGNRFNNDFYNLQILCCNCHANTPNYGSKNVKKTIKNRIIIFEKIKKRKKRKYSSRINNRKIERPTLCQLKSDVEKLGYRGSGNKYKVSDNAIRSWIRFYETGSYKVVKIAK